MKNTKTGRSAKKLDALDLYDDHLKPIKVGPLNAEGDSASVELELIDDGSGKMKWLTCHSCVNIRQNMDFDLAASSFFALTDKTPASIDANSRAKFMKSQRRHRQTIYTPPSPKDLPIRKKMASLNSFVLFKVNFHGGTIDVLARRFTPRCER